MTTDNWPHRVFPPLPQQAELVSRSNEMLRSAPVDLALRPPRGQRIPTAQLLLEQEMAQARGRSKLSQSRRTRR